MFESNARQFFAPKEIVLGQLDIVISLVTTSSCAMTAPWLEYLFCS